MFHISEPLLVILKELEARREAQARGLLYLGFLGVAV